MNNSLQLKIEECDIPKKEDVNIYYNRILI